MSTKVLVVEDEAPVAENLEALLVARGYTVVMAADGAEGVKLARKEKPQLILLDILLPKMGGFDVCKMLKSEAATKGIKVIMITGLGRMGDVETAFQVGASDYIIKPFDQERLFKKIDKVLGSP